MNYRAATAGLVLLTALRAAAELPFRELDARALVASNDCFAIELYKAVQNVPGNLILSPFSISMAMAMSSAGAAGDTLDQMHRALNVPPLVLLPGSYARLRLAIGDSLRTGRSELSFANSLWVQQGLDVLPAFGDTLKTSFAAVAAAVDFQGGPDLARGTINAWISERTRGRVKEMIRPEDITEDTFLMLVNAIYFKGSWAGEFNPEHTEDQPFRVTSSRSVRVPMMEQRHPFRYTKAKTLAALELPYVDRTCSLLILLPDAVDGIAKLEESLTVDLVDEIVKGLSVHEVRVSLPRFRLESRLKLKDVLIGMGMKDAFTKGRADFTRVHPSGRIYLQEVLHRAGIETDEKGTTAWAVTATLGDFLAELPVPKAIAFRVDRPFLFLLTENRTGTILFLGRVVDPSVSPQN